MYGRYPRLQRQAEERPLTPPKEQIGAGDAPEGRFSAQGTGLLYAASFLRRALVVRPPESAERDWRGQGFALAAGGVPPLAAAAEIVRNIIAEAEQALARLGP